MSSSAQSRFFVGWVLFIITWVIGGLTQYALGTDNRVMSLGIALANLIIYMGTSAPEIKIERERDAWVVTEGKREVDPWA